MNILTTLLSVCRIFKKMERVLSSCVVVVTVLSGLLVKGDPLASGNGMPSAWNPDGSVPGGYFGDDFKHGYQNNGYQNQGEYPSQPGYVHNEYPGMNGNLGQAINQEQKRQPSYDPGMYNGGGNNGMYNNGVYNSQQQMPNQQMPNQQMPNQQMPNSNQYNGNQYNGGAQMGGQQRQPSPQQMGMPNQQQPGMQQQRMPNQGMPNQGMPNQGMPNQGMPNQGMPNQGMPNQGMPNQGMPNQGMPYQGMPSQQMPNQGMPNQGMPNQGMPSQQMPNQGMPTQQMPNQGMPTQQMYNGNAMPGLNSGGQDPFAHLGGPDGNPVNHNDLFGGNGDLNNLFGGGQNGQNDLQNLFGGDGGKNSNPLGNLLNGQEGKDGKNPLSDLFGGNNGLEKLFGGSGKDGDEKVDWSKIFGNHDKLADDEKYDFGQGQADEDEYASSIQRYLLDECRYNPLPSDVAGLSHMDPRGNIIFGDIFGLSRRVRKHVVKMRAVEDSLLTVSVETHKEADQAIDVYLERGHQHQARLIGSSKVMGVAGLGARNLLQYVLEAGKSYFLVIHLEGDTGEVTEINADGNETVKNCVPIRFDMTLIPRTEKDNHWPEQCPATQPVPRKEGIGMMQSTFGSSEIVTLGDKPFEHLTRMHNEVDFGDVNKPYVTAVPDNFFEATPKLKFRTPVWDYMVKVPRRMHRFARFYFELNFRLGTVPMQLILEQFDENEVPQAKMPRCMMGCWGAVSVNNGQILDHALPTGFTYKAWVMVATGINSQIKNMFYPVAGAQNHCLEYDLSYRVSYEETSTPFELSPAAWLCKHATLPSKLIQEDTVHTDLGLHAVSGKSIHIRDHFGFSAEDTSSMEHDMEVVVKEESIFRASVYQAASVDVQMQFVNQNNPWDRSKRCNVMKHPGQKSSRPRYSLFCRLDPGQYVLKFYSHFKLGGIHPCQYFEAQFALKPMAMVKESTMEQCQSAVLPEKFIDQLQIHQSSFPRWEAFQAPVEIALKPEMKVIWQRTITRTDRQNWIANSKIPNMDESTKASIKLYLKMALHVDFVSGDFRFMLVKKETNEQMLEPILNSNGYSNLVLLDEDVDYDVKLYYVTGQLFGQDKPRSLCPKFSVDLRSVLRLPGANDVEMSEDKKNPYQNGHEIQVGHRDYLQNNGRIEDPARQTFGQEVNDKNPADVWLCKQGVPSFPMRMTPHANEQMQIDSMFSLPVTREIRTNIFLPANKEFLLKVVAIGPNGLPMQVQITPIPVQGIVNSDLTLGQHGVWQQNTEDGDFLAILSPPSPDRNVPNGASTAFTLTMKTQHAGVGGGAFSACPKARILMLLQPHATTPVCPWYAGLDADMDPKHPDTLTKLQQSASDHLGTALDGLVPATAESRMTKHRENQESNNNKNSWFNPFSHDLPKNSRMIWMDPTMEKTFEFSATDTAAIRVEALMQPAWLPLRIKLYQKPKSTLGMSSEADLIPIAVSENIESRLLLIQDKLHKGDYVLRISSTHASSKDMSKNLCSHVTLNVDLALTEEKDRHNMRTELIDVPELNPALEWPNNFNLVGVFDPRIHLVYTGVYMFEGAGHNWMYPGGSQSVGSITIKEPTIFRLTSEPIDLVDREMRVVISTKKDRKKTVITKSNSQLAHTYAILTPEENGAPKKYDIEVTADVAFLVTFGFVTLKKATEEIQVMQAKYGGMESCPLQLPPPAAPTFGSSDADFTIGPQELRVQNFGDRGQVVPLELKYPSVVYLETGADFLIEHPQIGVKIPEGIFGGEQRGRANKLQLELDAGKYDIILSQPKNQKQELTTLEVPSHCMEFTLFIQVTPQNGVIAAPTEKLKAEALGIAEDEQAVAASCKDPMAVPLPLDFGIGGGSEAIGGPADGQGRLLVRSRVLLTDLHNGRKQVFYNVPYNQRMVMKIGVGLRSGDFTMANRANALQFWVAPRGSSQSKPGEKGPKELEPLGGQKQYSADGFEIAYELDGREYNSVALTFQASGKCLAFDLIVETRPLMDIPLLASCGSQKTFTQEQFLPALPGGMMNLPYKYDNAVSLVKPKGDGIVFRALSFTLKQQAWVSTEVGGNFMLSNMDISIRHPKDPKLGANSGKRIISGDLEFINDKSNPLTVKKFMGSILEPGTYTLDLRDRPWQEAWQGSMQDFAVISDICQPMSVKFVAVPVENRPAILAVHPHPSFPLFNTQNIVVRIRFSEPVSLVGKEQELVTLGGMQASASNGLVSQAQVFSELDGGRVWQLTFSGDKFAQGMQLPLQIMANKMTGKLSNMPFTINWEVDDNGNLPSYEMMDVRKSKQMQLWSGGSIPSALHPVDQEPPQMFTPPERKFASNSETVGTVHSEKEYVGGWGEPGDAASEQQRIPPSYQEAEQKIGGWADEGLPGTNKHGAREIKCWPGYEYDQITGECNFSLQKQISSGNMDLMIYMLIALIVFFVVAKMTCIVCKRKKKTGYATLDQSDMFNGGSKYSDDDMFATGRSGNRLGVPTRYGNGALSPRSPRSRSPRGLSPRSPRGSPRGTMGHSPRGNIELTDYL